MRHSVTKNLDHKHVLLTGTLSELTDEFGRAREVLTKPHNQEMSDRYTKPSDNATKDRDWYGGTYPELAEALFKHKRDIQHVLDAKGKLAPMRKELKTGIGHTKRRKRRFSENDGDWEFDRRWEIAPFSASVKEKSPVKTLKIKAHFAMSCATDQATINEYGAFLACLVELIEARGITVGLEWVNKGNDVSASGSTSSEVRVTVKEPGEYISTQKLATVFWSNFMRRVGFYGIIRCADLAGRNTCGSLGFPDVPRQAVTASKGELELSPIRGHLPQIKDVVAGINQALG